MVEPVWLSADNLSLVEPTRVLLGYHALQADGFHLLQLQHDHDHACWVPSSSKQLVDPGSGHRPARLFFSMKICIERDCGGVCGCAGRVQPVSHCLMATP